MRAGCERAGGEDGDVVTNRGSAQADSSIVESNAPCGRASVLRRNCGGERDGLRKGGRVRTRYKGHRAGRLIDSLREGRGSAACETSISSVIRRDGARA